ncbi:MAG: 16S rRNA processing protein RimM [Clostridiales bacterium]|nr:16S rRNA processing protein RimM [Candidatus Cacconaster stercorequi]
MRVEFIPVGQIVNAHGIRGEVKLNPHGFDPEFIAEFDTIYIAGKKTEVLHARVHKSTVLLTLPGVEDMNAALALKGKEVSVARDDIELDEGEYLDAELQGMTVYDAATNEALGQINRVLNYPAHKVYEVRGGAHEYLIPAVRGVFVDRVALDQNAMYIHMMKGLATDEN